MAELTIRFRSNCLKRFTTFKMYIPHDSNEVLPFFSEQDSQYAKRPTKTLFLLHGFTGDAGNWIPEFMCEKYNFAVVTPSGENSFWLDGISSGHQFLKFIGEELIEYVRRIFGLAKSKEDTYICGMSMGGFGALHTALYYPEVFGKAAGLSSALIVHEVATMTEGKGNEVANYEFYRECFGEPSKVLESDNNPETLVKKLKAAGKKFPELLMCCGTEDFLLENNREFHRFLEAEKVPHIYEEDTGNHDMMFWNKYVEKFIPIMFG